MKRDVAPDKYGMHSEIRDVEDAVPYGEMKRDIALVQHGMHSRTPSNTRFGTARTPSPIVE